MSSEHTEVAAKFNSEGEEVEVLRTRRKTSPKNKKKVTALVAILAAKPSEDIRENIREPPEPLGHFIPVRIPVSKLVAIPVRILARIKAEGRR